MGDSGGFKNFKKAQDSAKKKNVPWLDIFSDVSKFGLSGLKVKVWRPVSFEIIRIESPNFNGRSINPNSMNASLDHNFSMA